MIYIFVLYDHVLICIVHSLYLPGLAVNIKQNIIKKFLCLQDIWEKSVIWMRFLKVCEKTVRRYFVQPHHFSKTEDPITCRERKRNLMFIMWFSALFSKQRLVYFLCINDCLIPVLFGKNKTAAALYFQNIIFLIMFRWKNIGQ